LELDDLPDEDAPVEDEPVPGFEVELGAELWTGVGLAVTGADPRVGGVTVVVLCVLSVVLPPTVVDSFVVVRVVVEPLPLVTWWTQVVECQADEWVGLPAGCGVVECVTGVPVEPVPGRVECDAGAEAASTEP
jgi:hypothetical protein